MRATEIDIAMSPQPLATAAVIIGQNPDAEATADRLRDAILAFDPEACVGEAEALLRGPPTSPRLRAWAIACVAEAGQLAQADALVAAMQRELPGEPWAEFAAVAVGLGGRRIPLPTLLPQSAAMLAALGEHPDALHLRARVLLGHERYAEVLELARVHLNLQQSDRVWALFAMANDDETRRAEAIAAAREVDGIAAISAGYVASFWLSQHQRNHAALAAIDGALVRSPRALPLHRQRWRVLYAQSERSEAQRRADVDAAITALLVACNEVPAALLQAAEMYREIGLPDRAEPLEARLLAEFADSPAAEALLVGRLRDVHYDHSPRSPEQTAEHRAALTAFLARSQPASGPEGATLGWTGIHEPLVREETNLMQFELLRDDPTTPPAALLAAVNDMIASTRLNPHITYSDGALALAKHKPYLERAEAIAREGLVVLEAFMAAKEQSKSPGEDIKASRDHNLSGVYDALGAVLMAAGRFDEAETELRTAHTLAPNAPPTLVRLAELANRRGDRKAAETYLLSGLDSLAWGAGRHPCELALEAMYRAEHGDLRGYPKYLAVLTAEQRAARRAAVLATAVAEPALPPPFALERLDGSTVTSESLRGKITVIKFWFIGCTPCVMEMPEFQALVDAYARDPAVEVLSIDFNDEPDALREWMLANKYRFDVLLDRGYAASAKVQAFPTLWVLDPEGRLVFTHTGTTRHLREEFGWRVESLRNRGK